MGADVLNSYFEGAGNSHPMGQQDNHRVHVPCSIRYYWSDATSAIQIKATGWGGSDLLLVGIAVW